jgi:hypothetical protein
MQKDVTTNASECGMSDGGHTYLSCSNCNAILVDIWVTRPNQPIECKVQAKCAFCGDRSFVKLIKGGYYHGGYGRIKTDDEDTDIPSTIVEDVISENDVFVFHTKKATPNAKPIVKR